MKKIFAIVLTTILALVTLVGCSGGGNSITVAVPNDATNEARALLLLQEKGYITLKEGAGITATVRDIAENPKNIQFREVEAAQVPNVLQDVDYAVINSNYAISAKLNPVQDSLAMENSSSSYSNILAVKAGNENTDAVKALKAALESQKVADFITEKYQGSIISVVQNPGNGFDDSVNYDALAGTTISIAASPTPHAEILAVAKEILAEKNITLDIKEFTDYVQPNNLVESGEIDCIMGCFSMEGRLDDYRWAGPYIASRQVVAVNENSDIYKLSDLEGKNLAVQSTTKPEGIFLNRTDERIPKLGNLISLGHRELIYTFLGKGYVDAVAAHEESVVQYMKDYDASFRILEEPLMITGIGVAFAKEDDRGICEQMSQTLEEMRQDGTSLKIIEKYLDDPQKYLEVDDLGY